MNKSTIFLSYLTILIVGVMIGELKEFYETPYSMPNLHSVSSDRTNPTEMMVVYDTLSKNYIFEFIDK